MSDYSTIAPVPAVNSTAPVQRVHAIASDSRKGQALALRQASGIAATTGGNLRAATAQLVVDPHSHDVVIRVSDASTDRVISQVGSGEVEAMTHDIQRYLAAAVAAGKRR
jgi:hypothetical protein